MDTTIERIRQYIEESKAMHNKRHDATIEEIFAGEAEVMVPAFDYGHAKGYQVRKVANCIVEREGII